MTPESITALVILVLTYIGVAVGRIPGLRLDRAGIAFLGGAAMIALGPLSLEEAFRAIDFDTIALLLGMMIVVAHLKVSGAFRALGGFAIDHAHAPFLLLVTVTMMAGVLSAFLVNDAICLVMAPIVLQVVRSLGRNPLPYLVAVATASNCGSVATITGNPQNMVIGTLSRIPYPAFAAALAPVAAFGLVAVILMVRLVYAQEFAFKGELEPHLFRGHMHGGQVLKASVTCVALAIAFFAGVAPAEGGHSGRRVPAAHAPDQASPHLSRARRAAAHPVRRHVRRRRWRGKGSADARPDRDGEDAWPRYGLAPVAVHRGAFQHREQCAGGVGAEAVHSDFPRSCSAPGSWSR